MMSAIATILAESYWWLPTDYSTHGGSIDALFAWFFWISLVVFVGVWTTLVYFLIRYRQRRAPRRAIFTHGNRRLEIVWTIIPAMILAGLALGSKQVWNNYRYSPMADDPNRAKVLVIGQQFKWNFIYPGRDGKFGRYLVYPKPTDTTWPVDDAGRPQQIAGVAGPAFLPIDQAVDEINKYVERQNPLGKDFADPAGRDDNFSQLPGREMIVPVGRPIEVQLMSKDVIHDFFLPNFRVKLDAVPGMRGVLHFQATQTSRSREEASLQRYSLDELAAALNRADSAALQIRIRPDSPGPVDVLKSPRYFNPHDAKKPTIIRDGAGFGNAEQRQRIISQLRAAGVTHVEAYLPGYFEIVCEELCGPGHYTMKGQMRVVEQTEYDNDPRQLDVLPVSANETGAFTSSPNGE